MALSGKITKLSKGKYYKKEETPFGALEPDRYQVVKDLLEDGDKTVGYLTGLSIYETLGLTTQISHTIQIGKNDVRPRFKRGRYTISFVRQKNTITKENIPLLQLLDALRYIKKIPDTTADHSCTRLLPHLRAMSSSDIFRIIRLAKKYPPSTRALLGAMLEECGYNEELVGLQDTLNPISTYKIPKVDRVLSFTDKWNIQPMKTQKLI